MKQMPKIRSIRRHLPYKLKFARRGIGMLEVMILIAVISSLMIAGFLQWRTSNYELSSRKEQINLSQADAALLAFTTIANRLPCPDVNRDGLEDCMPTAQKGWLPATTLRLAGADPGVQVGQLRYLVQRGAANIDLATQADQWRPLAYDSSAVGMLDSNYGGTAIQTLSDFCARLVAGTTTLFNPLYANVSSATPRLVAFALAHPGNQDADGDGDSFDGANRSSNLTQMEPGDRSSLLSSYDDVVFERSLSSMRNALSCDLLNNSIDSTALAADAVQAVADMQKGNIEDGVKAVAWAAASVVLTGLAIGGTIFGIVSDVGNSVADGLICAASLGLAVNACAAIGIHATAAALGGGETALNIVSVAASLVAVGVAGTALGIADANPTSAPQGCTVRDSTADIALLQGQIDRVNADITALNVSRTLVVTKLNNSLIDRNAKIANLRSSIINFRTDGSTSPYDGSVDVLVGHADAAALRQFEYQGFVERFNNAQTALNNAEQDVIRYQNLIDTRASETAATTTALQQESQTLANLRALPGTPEQIDNQQNVVIRLQGDLQLLTETLPPGQTPTLVLMLNRSIAERDQTATATLSAAQTALDDATALRNSTNATYSSAYGALTTAASSGYILTTPSGSTTTVITSPGVNIALADLFGSGADNGQTTPHPSSVFALPAKLQRELNSIDAQIASKTKILADMQAQLAELSKPTPIPPECNITANPARPFKPDEARAVMMKVDRKGATL
jgi:hypothetical protein